MSCSTERGPRALLTAFLLVLATATCGYSALSGRLRTVWTPAPDPVVLNDNGGWSWFEDERAVIDQAHGTLLVSSVANASGTGGRLRDGNVEVVAYALATGRAERTVLHAGLEADDHDSAALYVRPDGRYVAMYSKHTTDRLTRWRMSRDAGDGTAWGRERTLQHEAPTTYSNLYPAMDGRGAVLYSFVRTVGRDPHLVVSHDDGSTWSRGGTLLDGPGRPYVRYAADGAGRVHFITTEQHPDAYPTSIYHGVIADGRLLRSDGTVVDADLTDDDAVPPERLTTVFRGNATRRAWTIDLQIDADGRPYAAISVLSGSSDHRYYYARFDGSAWHVHFLGYAGSALYPAERQYTGLVALDPADPNRLFVSSDVHPATGAPLISDRDHRQHHELFEGVTFDGGVKWMWGAITANSTVDNLRPIVPTWDASHTALLWLRGTYTTYHDYDLDVVGIITEHSNRASGRSRPGGPPPVRNESLLVGVVMEEPRLRLGHAHRQRALRWRTPRDVAWRRTRSTAAASSPDSMPAEWSR
jgi:hypothetical protein